MSEAIPIIRTSALVGAFQLGQAAFRQHLPLRANPYTGEYAQEAAHHWDAGWVTACVSTSRHYGAHLPHDDNDNTD